MNNLLENANFLVNAKYSNLESNTITENYEFSIEENITDDAQEEEESSTSQYHYRITNNIEFKDGVDIEELNDENAVILNDEDEEYVTSLMSAIQERLVQVNRVHMEELGVAESENPIQYLIPAFLFSGETTEQINEQEVNAFNKKFELYEIINNNTK